MQMTLVAIVRLDAQKQALGINGFADRIKSLEGTVDENGLNRSPSLDDRVNSLEDNLADRVNQLEKDTKWRIDDLQITVDSQDLENENRISRLEDSLGRRIRALEDKLR